MPTHAVVKELANLWKVEPYRIDVRMTHEGNLAISLDGKAPSRELLEVFEKSLEAKVQIYKRAMN
jgi:hypothetical protein